MFLTSAEQGGTSFSICDLCFTCIDEHLKASGKDDVLFFGARRKPDVDLATLVIERCVLLGVDTSRLAQFQNVEMTRFWFESCHLFIFFEFLFSVFELCFQIVSVEMQKVSSVSPLLFAAVSRLNSSNPKRDQIVCGLLCSLCAGLCLDEKAKSAARSFFSEVFGSCGGKEWSPI